MIPKIIHYTGPTDRSKWHPVWDNCLKSWDKHFPRPEYTHICWTDEQLDKLVLEEYPQYADLYNAFPFHIMKIDFAEYCIMHKFGGIYHDLDMYCYKNFYEDIKEFPYAILESRMNDEFIQNCMFASQPRSEYWIFLMDEIKRYFYLYPDTPTLETNKRLDASFYIKDTTACYAMTRASLRYNKPLFILPKGVYNPPCTTYSEDHKTKHMLTNTWGKDFIDANIANMTTWEPGKFKDLQDWFLQGYKNRGDLDKDAVEGL